MDALANNLESYALGLPPSEKVCLAEKLLSSLDAANQPDLDAKWAAESKARIQAYEAGVLEAYDSSEVFARMEDMLKG